jgi:hypothetical protein
MNPDRFDRLSRLLARGVSRRGALRRVSAGIGTAAIAAGLSAARARVPNAAVTAQTCSENWEGPLVDLPPDTQMLGGDCQAHALGCRDFDGDGICTKSYLTAECMLAEAGQCPCPPPQPVCSPEGAYEPADETQLVPEACCDPDGLACYEGCHGSCVEGGGRPPVCARTCSSPRVCGCRPCPGPHPTPQPGPQRWGRHGNSCSEDWNQTRIYSAILWDIPPGQDWKATCWKTPGWEPPVAGRLPDRCPTSAFQWGEWDVPDPSCPGCKRPCYAYQVGCWNGNYVRKCCGPGCEGSDWWTTSEKCPGGDWWGACPPGSAENGMPVTDVG